MWEITRKKVAKRLPEKSFLTLKQRYLFESVVVGTRERKTRCMQPRNHVALRCYNEAFSFRSMKSQLGTYTLRHVRNGLISRHNMLRNRLYIHYIYVFYFCEKLNYSNRLKRTTRLATALFTTFRVYYFLIAFFI